MTPSSGNVFVDIGFDAVEAFRLDLRSDMMFALEGVIRERGLSQREAAKLFGVTQPRVSNLVKGRLDLFSLDMLVTMLARAGVRVNLTVSV
jgi:predicted XRE-type DNA-binding protein